VNYPEFDGLVISEYVTGAGLKGIITSELRVNIYTENFSAPDNAEIILDIPNILMSSSKFYIVRREKSGRKVTLTCRSKLFRLDIPTAFTDSDFNDDGEIGTIDALGKIASQAEFLQFSYAGDNVFTALPTLKKDFLFGKNCLSVLEKISSALCGTFREYQGGLVFIPFETTFVQTVPASKLSPLKRGFTKKITKISVTNGTETFVAGSGYYPATVKINSPLASEEIASAILGRLNMREYSPFTGTVKLNSIPCATCTLVIDDEEIFANNLKIYPRKSGIYAKVSCNAVDEDEWDYSGELERAVREKITPGESFGSMTLTPDGQIKLHNENMQTAVIYTDTVHALNLQAETAKIKAETLNLSETPKISLNADELLTEKKDLIGALNELFLAEPEGGEGGSSIAEASVLDDYHCGKVFGKRNRNSATNGLYGFASDTVGLYYETAHAAEDLIIAFSLQYQYPCTATVKYTLWVGNDTTDGSEVVLENKGTFTYTFEVPMSNFFYTLPLSENVSGEYNYFALVPVGTKMLTLTGTYYPNGYTPGISNFGIPAKNYVQYRIQTPNAAVTQSFFGETMSVGGTPVQTPPYIGPGNLTNMVYDYGTRTTTPRFKYSTGLLNQALAKFNAAHGG
jgi:hypothetical protein